MNNYFLLLSIFLLSSSVHSKCYGPLPDLKDEQEKALKLKELQSGLYQFMEGRESATISLNRLFEIDLNDEKRVEKRREEISLKVSDLKEKYELTDFKCFESKVASKLKSNFELEVAILKSKLDFLSLPQKRRSALILIQNESQKNTLELQNLKNIAQRAEEKIHEAQAEIGKADKFIKLGQPSELKELAEYIKNLQKLRQKIAQAVKRISVSLQEAKDNYQKSTLELSKISQTLISNKIDYQEVLKSYELVVNRWRTIVDNVVAVQNKKNISNIDLEQFETPVIAEFKFTNDVQVQELKGEFSNYQKIYKETKKESEQLEALVDKYKEWNKGLHYRELIIVGKLRSEFIRVLDNKKTNFIFDVSTHYINDLLREVKLIPYRPQALLISFIANLQEKSQKGIKGFFEISRQALILFLFLFIPGSSLYITRKLIGVYRKKSSKLKLGHTFERGKNRAHKKLTSLTLNTVMPYLPWVNMLFAFWLAGSIVKETEVDWLSEFTPYTNSV